MPNPLSHRTSLLTCSGTSGRRLITESPLNPARAHDDAHLVQPKVGRVEEHHLADLGIQCVEPERANGGALLGGGDGDLELDRVRAAQEAHQLPGAARRSGWAVRGSWWAWFSSFDGGSDARVAP
jgi:hypothetical protein